MDKVAILIDALRRIASYGSGNVNRTWIRAFHAPLILIAQEALEKVALCDAVQSRGAQHLHLERRGSSTCRS
jgi:hypothetical protein